MKTVRLALLTLALAACGSSGQPTIFRVAVDMRPISPVTDGNCYKGGNGPENTPVSNNVRTEEQWVIWNGMGPDATAREYLDFGSQSFTLGQAPTIAFSGDVETSQTGVFNATLETKLKLNNDTMETRDTSITVTFTDEGATPTGTIDLSGQYHCDGDSCPDEQFVADPRTCSVTLSFVARRIDAARISDFQATGSATGTGSSVPTGDSGALNTTNP